MNEVAKLDSGKEQSIVQPTGAVLPELFVINLCASMTPMPAVPKNLKGFENYKLYQVSRQEDGRRRFRLRLGFFTSEADAEWVLNSVRSLYPTAFTGCITHEDLRYTNDMLPAKPAATTSMAPAASPVSEPAAVMPAPSARPINSSAASVTPHPVAKATAPSKPAATRVAASPPAPAAPVAKIVAPTAPGAALTLSADPLPARTDDRHDDNDASLNQPFHVARGVIIPDSDLELSREVELPSKPAAQPAAPATKTASPIPYTAAVKPAASNKPAGPVHSATLVNPPKVVDDYVPILDTTLTIRTLTKTEAEDPNRPKWFAVQLALSEQPINLDTMPKLDIFAAYSLYSVALMEGGSVRHALRLGFFREGVSAEAVMGYLKAFFQSPNITQISSAEYDRFAEPKPKPQTQPAGGQSAQTTASVVKLAEKRPVAAPASAAAAAKPEVRPVKAETKPRVTPPARPQSFLSRLIGRQLD